VSHWSIVISSRPLSAFASDIDHDGDADVVASLPPGGLLLEANDVVWFKNSDGKGTFGFGAEQPIDAPLDTNDRAVLTADFDRDGDVDLLAGRHYYENVDGRGSFGIGQLITTRGGDPRSIFASDVDGDGDVDVLFASNKQLSWFENRSPLIGDANGDGAFNSADLVLVFQSGEYEDGNPGNSIFAEGDWNGDQEFDSSDLVLAFQIGRYEQGNPPAASRFSAAVDRLFATDLELHKSRTLAH
jgi:hypothetical protein